MATDLACSRGRISITNLAERHLRLQPPRLPLLMSPKSHINHESSRKAFETPFNVKLRCIRSPHINHESSRKAFETSGRVILARGTLAEISITNLAERHLRLTPRPSSRPRYPDINHESSRKAFETTLIRTDARDGCEVYQSRI